MAAFTQLGARFRNFYDVKWAAVVLAPLVKPESLSRWQNGDYVDFVTPIHIDVDVTAVNDLTFSYKFNSLLGLEIMTAQRRHAVLFSDKQNFTWTRNILHKRVDGSFVPLFNGISCVRWVTPGSEGDPQDETGEERHTPFGAGS
jgi:hypothetical protein